MGALEDPVWIKAGVKLIEIPCLIFPYIETWCSTNPKPSKVDNILVSSCFRRTIYANRTPLTTVIPMVLWQLLWPEAIWPDDSRHRHRQATLTR